jgi:hypothetical protein
MKNTASLPRKRTVRVPVISPIEASSAAVVGAGAGQNMVLSYRWVWYLFSLFIPFSGLLIALFLYDQDSRDVRKVGRNCLLIAFLVWVILPLVVLFALVLVSVLAFADWFADILTPTD